MYRMMNRHVQDDELPSEVSRMQIQSFRSEFINCCLLNSIKLHEIGNRLNEIGESMYIFNF